MDPLDAHWRFAVDLRVWRDEGRASRGRARERDLPPTWPDFERYYRERLAGFGPNETISRLFETIDTVRKPFSRMSERRWSRIQKGHASAQMFLIRATLPPKLRARLGLEWTAEDARTFARFCRATKIVGSVIPPSLRTVHMRAIGKLNVRLRAHPWAYRFFVRS